MQIAVCHYSYHRTYVERKWTPSRLAAEVKSLGVGAIDYHVRFLGDPAGAAKQITHALREHGLQLSGLSMSNDFNQTDPAKLREQIDAVKRWLPVAAEVKAPASRIFGGHLDASARNNAQQREQGMMRILDALREVVAEAEKFGIVLALENHGGLPMYGREQVDVIRRIHSPSLKATIDIGNYMQGGEEGHDGAAVAGPYAAYVHVKDFKKIPDAKNAWGWNIEACTIGDGAVDVKRCLQIVADAGFKGFVALEYEGKEDELTGVKRSIEHMRACLPG